MSTTYVMLQGSQLRVILGTYDLKSCNANSYQARALYRSKLDSMFGNYNSLDEINNLIIEQYKYYIEGNTTGLQKSLICYDVLQWAADNPKVSWIKRMIAPLSRNQRLHYFCIADIKSDKFWKFIDKHNVKHNDYQITIKFGALYHIAFRDKSVSTMFKLEFAGT